MTGIALLRTLSSVHVACCEDQFVILTKPCGTSERQKELSWYHELLDIHIDPLWLPKVKNSVQEALWYLRASEGMELLADVLLLLDSFFLRRR